MISRRISLGNLLKIAIKIDGKTSTRCRMLGDGTFDEFHQSLAALGQTTASGGKFRQIDHLALISTSAYT